jgi:hypothetical protein
MGNCTVLFKGPFKYYMILKGGGRVSQSVSEYHNGGGAGGGGKVSRDKKGDLKKLSRPSLNSLCACNLF